MTGRLSRSILALVLALLTAVAPVAPIYAQQQPQPPAQAQPVTRQLHFGPDYSRGKSQFPNLIGPYSPIHVEEPNLTNSPRLEQLIHDGKLELSLQETIELALENNMDINVQRFTPWIADTDILRTKGGGAGRGLAGTGTASALGAIPSETFDPVVTSTMSWDRRSVPVNNPFISGTGIALSALTNYTAQANFQYAQGFHTGTGLVVSFNNTRTSTTNPANLFNPAVQSSLFFGFSQQLLNGFGLLPNTRFIRIAQNSKRVADLVFQQQVLTSVTQVSEQYWELVFARQDVQVKQQSVDLAQRLYNDNKRQVEIGTLAPIEVVRAEAQLASAQQDLIVARTYQLQQQTLLVNLITKNPLDPKLRDIEIIPTDKVYTPAVTEAMSLADAVKEALVKRPDVLQGETNLKTDDINVRATRNALLPTLTLFGQYGATGLGGNSKILSSSVVAGSAVVDTNGNPIPGFFVPATRSSLVGINQGGLGDALDAVYKNNFPEYTVQLSLNIPIRNRPAQADSARALLAQRQDESRLQQLRNTVTVDVRNTQIALEQDRVRVAAAQKTRELQQQTLDAEQKKYQLGASTVYNVVLTQRDLATAASAEVRAMVDLVKAQIEFDRAMGRTLDVNRITIANAKKGTLPRDTLIPGTSVTGEIISAPKSY